MMGKSYPIVQIEWIDSGYPGADFVTALYKVTEEFQNKLDRRMMAGLALTVADAILNERDIRGKHD